MSLFDTQYRGFQNYRKQTKDDKDSIILRNAITRANNEEDTIEITHHLVTIDEDWIIQIEKGLEFVGKAISEERQFIRSDGEVVEIGKAKRVSKESVVHLACHSNLITREVKENETIIPDQIYTVEKLSDYAVYENRFLYMLLDYLKNFISLRYNKIIELTYTYIGSLTMKKIVSSGSEKLVYESKLYEEKRNDEYLMEHNELRDIITRINGILQAVLIYLDTPLMKEVSKSPMIHTPITKTNVLKMNNNFKNAVSLFEYVSSYSKVGYEVKEEKKIIKPVLGDTADEIADCISLLSFLTYEHGNGFEKSFHETYLTDEERRKRENLIQEQTRLEAVKKRIKTQEVPIEEYILGLEKSNKQLLKDTDKIVKQREQIESQITTINNITKLNQTLETTLSSLTTKIEEIKLEHIQEIEKINLNHDQKIESLNEKHKNQIDKIQQDYQEKQKKAVVDLKKELKDLTKLFESTKLELETNINNLNLNIASLNKDIESKDLEISNMIDEVNSYKARYQAQRLMKGLEDPNLDLTSEASFKELEQEYDAMTKFFNNQWKNTKKRIKKEMNDKYLSERDKK